MPITYTVTGLSSGFVGQPAGLTLTPSGLTSDTITLSVSPSGGTFNPSSTVTINSAAPRSISYTPAATGTKTITVTSTNGDTITGSPFTLTATAAPKPAKKWFPGLNRHSPRISA